MAGLLIPGSHTWRPPQHIRPIAIAVVRRKSELLVMAVRETAKAIKGWRPPGGGIEFGETAMAAVQREFIEEFGLPLGPPRPLATMENIFVHGGVQGHEVVFVFEAEFADPAAYARDSFAFEDGGFGNDCHWVPVDDFKSGRKRLFPDGLLPLLG